MTEWTRTLGNRRQKISRISQLKSSSIAAFHPVSRRGSRLKCAKIHAPQVEELQRSQLLAPFCAPGLRYLSLMNARMTMYASAGVHDDTQRLVLALQLANDVAKPGIERFGGMVVTPS